MRMDTMTKCARERVRELVRCFGFKKPEDVRLDEICRMLRIALQRGKLDGAEAALLGTRRRPVIMVSDRLTDPDRIRFAIAHELGHFLLGHTTECVQLQTGRSRIPWWEDPREVEASAVASEVLMPVDLALPTILESRTNLEVVRRNAEAFRVSLLTSAIRLTELSPEPCAAILVARNRVSWCAASEWLAHVVRRRTALSPDTLASAYFLDGSREDREGWVRGSAWFEGCRSIKVREHVTYSAAHRTALSIVWIPRFAAILGGLAA